MGRVLCVRGFTPGHDWSQLNGKFYATTPSLQTLTFLQRPRGKRLFHQLAIIILATTTISYFSMASDLGATPVQVEFRGTGTRQIWVCLSSSQQLIIFTKT